MYNLSPHTNSVIKEIVLLRILSWKINRLEEKKVYGSFTNELLKSAKKNVRMYIEKPRNIQWGRKKLYKIYKYIRM